MIIDIVDLTTEKYKNLTAVQLIMVYKAQADKDAAVKSATEAKERLHRKLLDNGTVRSTLFNARCDEIDEDLGKKVEFIRNDLDRQIAYENIQATGNVQGTYAYPANPNYNLTYAQRYLVVKEYYMDTYTDPNARFSAFQRDPLARDYLGEYYVTLYDRLASYC